MERSQGQIKDVKDIISVVETELELQLSETCL